MRAALLVVLTLASCVAQQAPPARDFGKIFLSNMRGLFSSENAIPGVFGVIAAGTATRFDDPVQDYFGGERVAPAIGSIGNVLGSRITIGAVSGTLFFTSYRGTNERFKAMSFDLVQAISVDTAVSMPVKYATRRERPDESNRQSFYSGHASATTAAATVIANYYPKVAIPAYLFAGFVGFSRIEKNRHWLSDVVAGHAVGFLIGRTVLRGHSPMKIGRLEWKPAVPPGGGVMIDARINLKSGDEE